MPEPTTPRPGALAAFGSADFRLFWAATLVSNLGTLMQNVGAGWLMTELSDSREMVALVQSSATLPIMLFSLLAGAMADTGNRRTIMLAAQMFMLVSSALLTALALVGLLTPWLLIGATFLLGMGTAMNNSAWQASLGDLVPRAHLQSAVLLNSVGFNLMRSVGPAVGGLVVAVAGAGVAFAANTLSYLAFIAALLRWKGPPPPPDLPRETVGHAIAAGLRYAAMSPNILTVLMRGAIFGITGSAVLALLPLVASEQLGGTALTFGLLLGAFGVGAILAAFGRPRLDRLMGNEVLVRCAFLSAATGCVILAASRHPVLSGLGAVAAGASWVTALSMFNVSIQLSAPRWVVGRALSLYQASTFGGMALGGWVWGGIAEGWGIDTALLVAAGTLVLAAAVGVLAPLPQPSTEDLNPLGRFAEPELRLDLRQRSGPIMVMVDYSIAEADVAEFLALMAQRRRIRIRDGAQRWALLRDLENPDIWSETYHVPTWVEYVRHHARRTVSDVGVGDRLLALHQGPGRPHVHRMIERHTVPRKDDTPMKPHTEPH